MGSDHGLNPWAVGLQHEQSASAEERRQRGAWYTPRELVEALVAEAIDSDAAPPGFAVDPTCGGGAFLLGVLDRLVSLGVRPEEALGRVGGLDVSAGAVAATRQALRVWAESHGLEPGIADRARVETGDSLAPWPPSWPVVDLVIGNPPFATPLKSGAFPASASAVKEQTDHAGGADLLGPYADLAAVHLASNVARVRAGGRVCLVLPQSLLAGRDSDGLRRHLARVAPLRSLWVTDEAVFDAGVRVWAPVLVVEAAGGSEGGDSGPVRLSSGFGVPAVEVKRAPWAELAAEGLGTPPVELSTARVLGQLASATAGFRDEFYGLAGACTEGASADTRPRLVTVGSLDPLHCTWGTRPMRIAKRDWDRPVVDEPELTPAVGAWLTDRLVPKVVLPTQSRVFEPVVDRDGSLAPLTPVLSIHADADRLDHVAAVLLAPPVVAWARRMWFGAAMSTQAIKLAARDVATIPLPPDESRWDEAARLISEGEARSADPRDTAVAVAEIMTSAYRAGPDVFDWWRARLG